jgi:hypothetical protein
VAEEVVLAADLLVEDLAEAAVRWWIWRRRLEVAQWRLVRLCKHSIMKKSCKLQLFFMFSLLAKDTSFIMLYTGKFLLST